MTALKTCVVVFVLLLASASNAFTYGGGEGLPPGHFDNPHQKSKLVCQLVKKQLPFDREMFVPVCRVVKEEVQAVKEKSLLERIKEVGNRIKNGGK